MQARLWVEMAPYSPGVASELKFAYANFFTFV